MPNVDERVVRMQFDNKQFEKGVAESLKTLDKLKDQLKLEDASKSLINLNKVVSDLNFGSVEDGINRISNAFTPLGKIAQRTLDQIADKAVNTGKQLIGMLTGFNDMVAGKAKYEMETKAVQTITNATGKSVQEVEGVLSKLMHYTDETSYDFAQMASSIGKFTSVGIELETAEEAMEGIANWAAKSGADKQAANRAMYNISQALGSGSMMVRDWMSIENANMATKEFKETAIETAKELGVLAENTDITYLNFRESLQSHWLNAEVLTETLRKYGDQTTEFGLQAYYAAQNALTFTDAIDAVKDAVSSGWMQTMQHLFGNLDEARVFWTNLATWMQEFAGVFSETRNHLLENWHALGGYEAFIESITNVWRTFENIVLGVREALQEVFPPETAEHLVTLTEKVRDATGAFRKMFAIDRWDDVEETFEKTVDHAENLSNVLKVGDKGEEVEELMAALKKAGYELDLSEESDNWGIYTNDVKRVIEKLQKDLHVSVTGEWDAATRKAAIAKGVFKEIAEVTEEVTQQTDFFSKGMSRIQEIVKGISGALKIALSILKGGFEIASGFISIFSPVIDLLTRFGAMFGMMFKNLSDDIEKGGAISQFVESITVVFGPLANAIETVTGFFHDFIDAYAFALRETNRRNTFGNFFAFLINYLKNDTILGPIVAIGESIIGIILNIAGNVIGTVKNVVSIIGSFISQIFRIGNEEDGTQSGLFTFIQILMNLAYSAASVLSSFVAVAGNAITMLVSGFMAFASPAIETGVAIILKMISVLTDSLPTILPILIQLAPVILAVIGAIAMISKTRGPVAGAKASLLGIVGALAFFVVSGNKDKIINFFKQLWATISQLKIVDKFSEIIANLGNKLKELYEIISNPDLSLIEKIKAVINKVANDIIKKLADVGHSFKTLFIPDKDEANLTFLERLQKRLEPFASWLIAITEPITKAWAAIFGVNFADDNATILENILLGIRGAFDAVVNTAASILNSGFIDTIITGIFAVGIYRLGAGISNFSKNIGLAINAFGKDLTIKKDTIGTTALKFAGAVAIISASIALLSQIKFEDTEGVINGLHAYLAVIGATTAAILAMQVADKLLKTGKGKYDFLKKIFELSASIAMISASLLMMQKFLSGDHVLGSIGLLTGIIVALLGVDFLMSKFGNRDNKRNGLFELCKGVLAVAGAVAIVSATIWALGLDKVWGALGIISVMLIELGAIAVAMAVASGKANQNGKTSSSIKGLVGLCAGIYIIVAAVGRMISVMNRAKNAWQFVGALLTVGAIVGGIGFLGYKIIEASKTTRGGKSNLVKSTAVLGGIIAGVIFIAGAVSNLMKAISAARLTDGDTVSAWMAIGSMAAILAGAYLMFKTIADAAKSVDAKTIAATTLPLLVIFGGLAANIYLLTEGMSKLKDIDPTVAISVMGGMVGLVTVMALFVGAMSALKVGAKEMAQVAVGIAAILTGIAVGVWVVAQLGSSAVEAAGDSIWILGSRLGDFSNMISDVSWEDFSKVETFFSSTLFTIISSIVHQDYDSALACMDKLVRISESIAVFSRNITGNVSSSVDINTRINGVMDGIKAITDTASQITIPESLTNGNLIMMGASLALYSTALASTSIDNLQNAIDIADNVKTVSEVINGIGLSNNINTTLTEFGAAIQLYYAAIAGAGLDENGNPIKTSSTPIDSGQLSQIMSGLANAIDPDTINEISSYAEGKDHDVTTMALGITALADAFDVYGQKIGGLKTEEVNAANSVLEAVSGVYTKLSNSNLTESVEYVDGLYADNKLALFAGGLTAIAGALAIYKDDIGGIKDTEVESANKVLDKVTELDKYLNSENQNTYLNIEGMSDSMPEQSKIQQFSGQLVSLGSGLASYLSAVKDVKEDDIKSGERVLTFVSTLQRELPKTGGLFAKLFAGEQSLDSLSTGLGALGNGIKNYKTNIGDTVITDEDLKSFDGIKLLAESLGAMGKSGGIMDKIFNGGFSWETLTNGLEKVPQKLREFQDALVQWEFQPEAIEPSLVAMERLGAFIGAAREVYNSYNDGMGNGGVFDALTNGIEQMFFRLSGDYLSEYFGTSLENVKMFGSSILEAINLGIDESVTDEGVNTFTDTLLDVVQDAIDELEKKYDNFKNVGAYLCEGMSEGIHESLEKIVKAAQSMDNALIGQVQEDTEVHSPSRKFEWIAQMCAIGLANGFEKYSYLVTDAVSTIGSGSVETIMAAFKEDQLKNVGFGALGAIRELLLKGGPDREYTEKDLEIVKQLLIQSKYLSSENVNNVDAVRESMKAFKQEVLGIENATGDSWDYRDSLKLLQYAREALYENGGIQGYDKIQYESDMLKQLGIEAASSTDKLTEANERLLESVETLSDMYETLNEEQKQVVSESIDPDWMTEALYWANVGDDLVKKYGEQTNPIYDYYQGNLGGINWDSDLNSYFNFGGSNILDQFSQGLEGFNLSNVLGEGFDLSSMFSGLLDPNSDLLTQFKNTFTGLFDGEGGIFSSIGTSLFGEGGLISEAKNKIVEMFNSEDGVIQLVGNKIKEFFGIDGEFAESIQSNPVDVPLNPVIDMSNMENNDLLPGLGGDVGVRLESTNLTADLSTESAQIINSGTQSQINELQALKQVLENSGNANKSVLDQIDSAITGIQSNMRNVNVYIDGNRLVGYMGPKIDNYLGARSIQVGRLQL